MALMLSGNASFGENMTKVEAVALVLSGVGVMIIWGQLSSLPPVFSF
jgi:EamA domain-containing membrane protein RarD